MLKEVSIWNETKDPSKCNECLNELLRTKSNLAKSLNPQAWPNLYLSEVSIQQYLKWVVEVMQGKNASRIKVLMQHVVEPSDLSLVENFPGKHSIFKWLNQTDLLPDSQLPKCTNLRSLQDCVKIALEQLHMANAGYGTQTMEQAQKRVTSYIAELINDLRTHMQQQKYDYLFLITLLYPLNYDTKVRFFGHLLSTDDLDYLSKVLEAQITEFKQVKSEGMVLKLQAYLFHLSVSFLHSRVDLEFQSMCCDHLHYLQKEIPLDPSIKDILVRHSISSSYDFAGLQQDLLDVMSMSGDDAQRVVGSQLLNFLSAVQSARQHGIPCKHRYQKTVSSKQIRNVFDTLGISNYYPQKLTRKHALCIRQQTPESKQFHFYILEKIMMHHYQYWECLIQNDAFILHPVDSILALLLCADNFLRQDLLVKLSTCQLAIPLLLPDPCAQNVTLPLWGMRSIVKEWKHKDTDTGEITLMECSMVEHAAPFVSFMRFSDSNPDSGRSKSRILNEVIGNSQHNSFFNWDCEGGNAERVLADGVVEMCWYLPAGKEADSFNEAIAFTNLRGDARKHRIQFQFLRQVSDLNFILLTQDDLDEESIEVLEQLCQAPGVLVLMFPDAQDGDELTELETLLTTGYKTIKMKRKSLAVIKREIRSLIVNLHVQKVNYGLAQFKSLKQCSEIAKQSGILIDEDDPECIAGLSLAKKVLQKVREVKDGTGDLTTGIKDEMLPLQGQAMWHTWAQHNKERHRHLNKGFKTTPAYNIEMEYTNDEIRRKQLALCDPPTPVMKSFMSSLIQQKGHVRDYFLHWLKFLLDQRSQQILLPLRSRYDELKCELQKSSAETTGSRKKEHAHVKKLIIRELTKINDKMILASLGVEHLFRELGQMYESVMDVQMEDQNQQQVLIRIKSTISCLPRVAAELLVAGYPFELMDGDASHVPMTWMMAVLDELHTLLKHKGDVKVFAVSVLGFQSSGKSTLMNTMFGVKFAVCGGRRTHGAFIQLIPIQRHSVTCDYLLVVDTVGLRDPEIDSQKMLMRDNEMTTFVIGLANVTIINIFGETPSDVHDILRAPVHAFLRMKSQVELKPSCQFVHQNLTAIAAGSKLTQGRGTLMENLDEMVKYAAKEEQCESEYTTFDQVMSFDLESNVWYFPSLWKGDPPMAPVNLGYSEMAQKLKSTLTTVATTAKSRFSVLTLRKHIQQMWSAVLYESFVFSFNDMLEMTAYNELDSKRGEWSSELQSSIMKLQSELDNEVFSSDVVELEGLERKLISHSEEVVREVQERLVQQAEEFFKNCGDHVEIMIQWKEQTKQNLKHLCEKQRDQTVDYCRSLIRNRRDRVALDKLRSNIYQKVQDPLRKLALELRGRKLEKQQLEMEFSHLWEQLELMSKAPRGEMKVESLVEGCLKQFFRQKQANKLTQKLTERGLSMRGKPLALLVDPKQHLTKGRGPWFKDVFGESCQVEADRQTVVFCRDAEKHVKNICSDYSDSLSFQVLRKVAGDVDNYNRGKETFNFTEEYKIDLCLTVAGHAVRQFEEMIRENAPSTIFERLRDPFYIFFERQYCQRRIETAAAKSLSSYLKGPIRLAMTDFLVGDVICAMKLRDRRFYTKHNLLCNILLDLEKKRSFADYVLYLENVEVSLRSWVKVYTLEYCRTVTEGQQSNLERLANAQLNAKFAHIRDSAKAATQFSPKTLRHWLTKFHEPLRGSFHLNLEEICQVLGLVETGSVEDKPDFEFFNTELIENLPRVKEEIRCTLISLPEQMKTWRLRPYDLLADEMIGCCEQCPFCGTKCEYMDPDHPGDHRASIHRPQCLGGSGTKLSLELCTSAVEGDAMFMNKDTDNKPHPYKKYREIYKNWMIVPNASCYDSSFWKYFVAHYTDEIAAHFGMKKPHPGSYDDRLLGEWKKLEKEKVLETLKASFNL